MAKLADLVASKYLAGKNIKGLTIPVKLIEITREELPVRDGGAEGEMEVKYAAWFTGMDGEKKDKGLILNKTNIEFLELECGIEDTEEIPADMPDLIMFTVPTELGTGIRLRLAEEKTDDVPF